jgi:transcriptional regulator with XRE-family HTH domain
MKPSQSRAARALIDWSQPKLAQAAGLGVSTVVDFERERRQVAEGSVAAMRTALETAGVEFIPENGGGAGVRLRKAARPSSAPSEGEAGIIESSDM